MMPSSRTLMSLARNSTRVIHTTASTISHTASSPVAGRFQMTPKWAVGLVCGGTFVVTINAARSRSFPPDNRVKELSKEVRQLQKRMDKLHAWMQERESRLQIRVDPRFLASSEIYSESPSQSPIELDIPTLQSDIIAYNALQDSLRPQLSRLAQASRTLRASKAQTSSGENWRLRFTSLSPFAVKTVPQQTEDIMIEMKKLVEYVNGRHDEFEMKHLGSSA